MQNNVTEFICEMLEKKVPLPKDVNLDNYRYLEKGHIDSLSLVKFIYMTEDKFDIEFSAEDTQSDEFRTIGGLVKMITDKINKK
ncbi:MAG: acyl carrier protein [Candidatus Ozemobacteraceae bacterium]|jgi:D-alanine--poly(phosphoribitol) ligase subunit 2